MPIENERKFVLDDDGKLEQHLAGAPGVTRSFLRQAYLDVSGLRIRSIEADGKTQHIFTYKREVDGQVVEIETEISATDFDRLWTQRRETLQKARYSWTDGRFHWDVDFFKTDDGRTYFAMAEVEMPETGHRAAAASATPGVPSPGGCAARRPAIHVQTDGGSGSCRAPACRHPPEGESRMKIARIDSHPIKVPFTFGGNPTGYGGRNWTTNNILLVRVETDTGLVGWGEAFCYGCTDAVRAALHHMIAPIAIGRDAGDIARLSRDLQQMLHLFGRYGITIFALSGLDIALWDIAGKAANLPLHRLLGGAGRESLAGLCQPAEVSRSRARGGAGQAGARPGLPPYQAARDGGGRGAGGARGGGRRTLRSWSTPTARGRPSRRAT